MGLEIIGAGFGRTGTLSVRKALSDLGYPCYHMFDVLFNPARKTDIDVWLKVADAPAGTIHDWDRLFAGYRAVVDFPSCAVWRDLMVAYPNAKVLLTLHAGGANAWYESTRNTIYVGTGFDSKSAFGTKVNAVMDRLVWSGMLQDAMEDRATAIARYEAHIAEVRAAVPPEKLLIFTVTQGWDPLCAFLGIAVPETPFLNVNNRDEMRKIMSRLDRFRSFGRPLAAE